MNQNNRNNTGAFIFSARLKQGHIFKKIFDALNEVMKEVKLQVSDSGIQVQELDTSHIVLINLVIESTGFENYQCTQPKTLGVNV